MIRNHAIKLIKNYFPEDEQEIAYKARTLHFIEQNERCFERSLEIGHITASSWLLDNTGSKALLMHHAKLDIWCQLGGHCDGNSDILAVAIKEAQEESGIFNIFPLNQEIFDIDVHLIPAKGDIKEHLHYDIRFLLQVRSQEQIVSNNESKELRWITLEKKDLPTNERSVTRMHEKWVKLKNLKNPIDR